MRVDRGMVISLIGHGVFLGWALVSFARPLEHQELEALSADVMTADEFNKITSGVEKGQKTPTPKPFVEKEGEPKPVEDITAKVTEKKEVKAATEQTQPEPTPKKLESKPPAAPDKPKEEAKTPDKKEPDQKIDPIADALKKDEAKKPEKEKKVENKPQPVKKPEPQERKFDPRATQALLDKRNPQRMAAAGTILNPTPYEGRASGTDSKLQASEIAAFQQRVQDRWNQQPGTPEGLKVRIIVSLRRDGTLAAPPQVLNGGTGGVSQAALESMVRALYAGQPYDMFRVTPYDVWGNIDAMFVTTN